MLRKPEGPSQRERPVAARFASDSAEIDPDTDSDPDTDGVETQNHKNLTGLESNMTTTTTFPNECK